MDFRDSGHEQMTLLIDLSRKINSRMEVPTILSKVVEYSILLTRAERGFLFLADGTDHLKVKVALDERGRSIVDEPIRISSSVVSKMLADGIPIFLENVKLNPAYANQQSLLEMGVQYVMGVPLKLKGRILGFIYVDNRKSSRRFSPLDRQILTSFADQAAFALENARLNEERSTFQQEAALGKMSERLLSTVRLCAARLDDLRSSLPAEGVDGEERRRLDSALHEVSATLDDQVREFREYGEFIDDRMYIKVEYGSLDEVVEGAVARMTPLMEEAGVRRFVSLNIKRETAFDGRWIERALECVLRNALEAVRGRPEPEIAVTTAPVPEGLLVEVRDNGPGMDPELVDRAFMPFTSWGKGSRPGLGLTLAARIVEHHRGSIEIRSRAGRGTSVWIVVPANLRPSMFPRPPRASVPPAAL
jgi:signal transduction histidine kinase